MNFFTPEARLFKPWSSSKLSTLDCGLRFEWQYSQKIREYEIPEELETKINDDASKFGSGMHKALELRALGASVDDALERAIILEKLVTSQGEELRTYRHSLTIFETKLNKFKKTYGILEKDDFPEIELGASAALTPADYNDTGTYLRGKLDRLLLTPDGRVAILIDYKTGKSATLKYAEEQLDFYATLILANFPNVRTIRSGLYFTRISEMIWAPKVVRDSYLMGENNSTVMRINQAISSFYAAEEPTINITSLCKWCIYKEMCKVERRARRKRERLNK